MADDCFGHPRLAAIYDPLEPDRSDLDAYLRMAEEFGVHRVLDIGCGTGVFALLLADRGADVVGIDPAQASVDVARAKPRSERVRWICGDATALPPLQVDLATMTANVAQEIVGQKGEEAAHEPAGPCAAEGSPQPGVEGTVRTLRRTEGTGAGPAASPGRNAPGRTIGCPP